MTAPVSPPQPTAEPVRQHTPTQEFILRAMVKNYTYGNSWDRLDAEACIKAADEIASLKARAEQAEQSVDVLESNAREQANLLADTGRRVEELEALIEFWTSDGRLQTFEDRQRFRKAALAALPPSSSTGLTDMTLKARNDALHENNVLALRQIEELEAALRFIADGYDNHDVNHVDYRVKVYQVALDALGLARDARKP